MSDKLTTEAPDLLRRIRKAHTRTYYEWSSEKARRVYRQAARRFKRRSLFAAATTPPASPNTPPVAE